MFAAALIQGCDEGKANAAVEQVVITVDQELNARQKVTAHMKAGDYDGLIGIKLRGNSSLGFNQKKYTVELIDEQGKELDAELLGMPAHSDWVLLAPYNDVSAVRDPLAFQLWRDMGHWAPRTRMVELTLNGDYRGIYILSEAIKRGKDRVDIAKMKKGDTAGLDVTGGYLLRIDTYNDDDATFTSKVPGIGEGNMTSQVVWSCIYPKKKKLQPEQLAYIQNYVDTVEQVIQSEGFADPKTGYARYIDVSSFVDYPVWDYNLAYGNANFANADNPEAWCYEGASNNPTPALWQRLLQDPAFRKAVKVRYQSLRKDVLSNKAINEYVDRHARLLAPYLDRHFEKYPELLVDSTQKQQPAMPQFQGGFPTMGSGFPPMGSGFPPMGGGFGGFGGGGFNMVGMFAAYRVSSYDEEIKVLKQWLADRLAFLDRNIERFDKDWQPRIQEPKEIKMQMPPFGGGGFRFPFPH